MFGLWPRFVGFVLFLLFASLSPLAKRKSGWGICGSSFLVWLWFLLLQSICRLQGPCVLAICISCLLSCKDRAFSATSATLEEKKGSTSHQRRRLSALRLTMHCRHLRSCYHQIHRRRRQVAMTSILTWRMRLKSVMTGVHPMRTVFHWMPW